MTSVMAWISVKDRLPEQFQEVLVWDNEFSQVQRATCVRYGEGNAEVAWDCEAYLVTVTHWQPLPDAPTQEESCSSKW